MFFPHIAILKYLFVGYVGTMLINAIFPHLLATILLKRYAPGLITGILVNVPLNICIINYIVKSNMLSLGEVLVSVIIFALVLLLSLTTLFKVGDRLINWDK